MFWPEYRQSNPTTQGTLALVDDENDKKHHLFSLKGYITYSGRTDATVLDKITVNGKFSQGGVLPSGQPVLYSQLVGISTNYTRPSAVIPKSQMTIWNIVKTMLILRSCEAVYRRHEINQMHAQNHDMRMQNRMYCMCQDPLWNVFIADDADCQTL